MKKNLNLFLFILITSSLYSQSKIRHTNIDIDIGIGVFVFSHELSGLSVGPTLNINSGFKINKNIISVNILYGGWGIAAGEDQGPLDFTGPSEVKLFKIDALYGVQLKILFKKIIIEPSVGIGFYGQRIESYTNPILESAINFPLRMSLIFFQGGKVDVGFNANYDINKLNKVFSASVFLRLNLTN